MMYYLQDPEGVENNGNVLLDRLSGAELYIVPRKSPYKTHLKPRMEALAEAIEYDSSLFHLKSLINSPEFCFLFITHTKDV